MKPVITGYCPDGIIFLVQHFCNGNVKAFLELLHEKGIKCSKSQLNRAMNAAKPRINVYLLNELVNKFHLPTIFFVKIRGEIRKARIENLVDNDSWFRVVFKVRQFIMEAYFKCNRSYTQLYNRIRISRGYFDKLSELNGNDNDHKLLETLDFDKFIGWIQAMVYDMWDFIDDKNVYVSTRDGGDVVMYAAEEGNPLEIERKKRQIAEMDARVAKAELQKIKEKQI